MVQTLELPAMKRETTCVALIVLLSGTTMLAVVILTLVGVIILQLDLNNEDAILWDQVAIYLILPAVLGPFLIWLGISYFRRIRALK